MRAGIFILISHMLRTIALLCFSLLAIPALVFWFDLPPSADQWEILRLLARICVIAAGLCFLVSSMTRNYSQVDKLWSIMPIVYVWVVVIHTGYNPRLLLMAVLVSLWGVRLTYNFARRGGYHWKFWTGEEDYRWAVLRQKPGLRKPLVWMLFNLCFISFYQMGLVLLFTLPIVKAMPGKGLQIWDGILALALIILLVIETRADQQQWAFQNAKKNAGHSDPKYAHGFVRSGLWQYSRHPNYAAEQGIWIVFYLFSVVATGSVFNWSVAGVLLLLLLFDSSANFSEGISAEKYPEYRAYQKRVGKFLPGIG